MISLAALHAERFSAAASRSRAATTPRFAWKLIILPEPDVSGSDCSIIG
jgi:hypothetical protein